MAEPGTDKHKGRVAVRETAYHTGSADAVPAFTGKIAVGQCFLDTVLYLLGGRLSFTERSFATTALAFFLAALLLFWA